MTQKISEWLNDYGSHDIYTAKFVAEDFEKCTGQEWPKYIRTFSTQETRDTIEARGLGVVLARVPHNARVVWGYAMAEDFARNLADFTSSAMGRGSIMRSCVAALEGAGL